MKRILFGVVLATAACAHEHKQPVAQVEKAPVPVSQEKLEDVLTKADASEPGRVASVKDGFLELDPYRAELEKERLRITPEAPVFEGENQVGVQNLQPGTDVRVFYKFPKGEEPPEIVGVRVLTTDEAKAAEDASEAPPKPE